MSDQNVIRPDQWRPEVTLYGLIDGISDLITAVPGIATTCEAFIAAQSGAAHELEGQGRHIADAWREACTIRTVEQLAELPPDSTVMSLVAIVAYQRARTPHSDWYSTGLSTIKSIGIGK